MLVSNGYGKVINIDVETYLNMTETEWRDEIIAGDYGNHIEDPFFNTFSKPGTIIENELNIIEIPKDLEIDDLDLEIEEE